MQLGHDGSQKGAYYVDSHGEKHHPFGAEEFRYSTSGNLGYYVTPEVGAKQGTLDGARPDERAILQGNSVKRVSFQLVWVTE